MRIFPIIVKIEFDGIEMFSREVERTAEEYGSASDYAFGCCDGVAQATPPRANIVSERFLVQVFAVPTANDRRGSERGRQQKSGVTDRVRAR